MANIATDGPESQSHQLTPRKPLPVNALGPDAMPSLARRICRMPRGSWNQLGPLTPNQASTALMLPEALNRNNQSTVIATELVTEGK